MAFLYRIESFNHDGLYSNPASQLYSSLSTYLGLSSLNPSDYHPSPIRDRKLYKGGWSDLENRSEYHFGFSSYKQLNSWLTNEQIASIDSFKNDRYGYRIAIYYVDDKHLIDGDHQCVFLFKKAIRIGHVSGASLFNKRFVKQSRFKIIMHYRIKKILTEYTKHCNIMGVLRTEPTIFEKWLRSYYNG